MINTRSFLNSEFGISIALFGPKQQVDLLVAVTCVTIAYEKIRDLVMQRRPKMMDTQNQISRIIDLIRYLN